MIMTDKIPTIEDVERAIAVEKPTCLCGSVLPPVVRDDVWTEGHEGGVRVEGYEKPRWLYVTCRECGYDYFVGKIREIRYLWD